MRARFIILLALLGFTAPAAATPLVADLSVYHIDIDAGFTGAQIFLFGARNDNGDIVVVVRGPEKNFTIRKKERIAGVWMNTDHMTFRNLPDFYALASSKSLDQIKRGALFQQLGIGTDALLHPPEDPAAQAQFTMFSDALMRYQTERRLYPQNVGTIQFMGETLFKTQIEFPDTIPKGDYTAEIYLISDGQVVGMQSTPIHVAKSGFDAFVSNYAHENPLLYGISAVVIALCAGWGAGRLFERI